MQVATSASRNHDGVLQDVVIIGAGIAGLASALALHRLGLKPLVLESADELLTSGSGIGLWRNAWRALEVLGVTDVLNDKFEIISGVEFCSTDGNILTSLNLNQEVAIHAADRKSLLDALIEQLPDGMIIFGARLSHIRKLDEGYTEVECQNGQRIRTKVLVGCDGTGSVVAKWLGLKKPQFAGYTITRGVATFPDEHKLKNVFKQISGRGARLGIVPMGTKSVYWFLAFNTKGIRIDEPELIQKEVLMHMRNWKDPIATKLVKHSPLDTLSRRDVADRWTWPGLISGPALYQGGVTIAGDALHPMTPALAQGGCCALEDAVVLGRHLGGALLMSKEQGMDGRSEMELLENALKNYTHERWPRALAITIKAYIIGAMMQVENGWFCYIRDTLLHKMMSSDKFTSHTLFDCGPLLKN